MRTKTVIIGLVVAAAITFIALAAPYEKRAVPRGYMHQKLAYSQGVLEGLTWRSSIS